MSDQPNADIAALQTEINADALVGRQVRVRPLRTLTRNVLVGLAACPTVTAKSSSASPALGTRLSSRAFDMPTRRQ
jgi:hypothetical protein